MIFTNILLIVICVELGYLAYILSQPIDDSGEKEIFHEISKTFDRISVANEKLYGMMIENTRALKDLSEQKAKPKKKKEEKADV